jgi:hypothetical protein
VTGFLTWAGSWIVFYLVLWAVCFVALTVLDLVRELIDWVRNRNKPKTRPQDETGMPADHPEREPVELTAAEWAVLDDLDASTKWKVAR